MLIKTRELFKNFIEQLGNICFQKDLYDSDMKRINGLDQNTYEKQIYQGGFGNQPFSKIMFVGSFFKKKYGEYLSDIDVTEFIEGNEFDENFVQRFQYIIENIEESSFIYMRFFCGEDTDLIPPWHIDGKGSCKFNIEDTEKWLNEMKVSKYLDDRIKKFIDQRLSKDNLSVRDLLDVEEEMKKYNSISWKPEDIIKGFVDFHGKKYRLLDVLKNYNKKKTLRYVFKYKNHDNIEDMLLIDYSIRQKTKQIEEGSLESRAYYLEDPIKIIKMYKRWILPEYNQDYDGILNETTRKYTTIAFRLDMIMRLRRYQSIEETQLERLEGDVNTFISNKDENWKITLTEDCKTNKQKIKNNAQDFKDFLVDKNNIDDVYSNIQVLITSEAKKGVIEMEKKNMLDYKNIEQIEIYKLRAVEVRNNISKDILRNRINSKYACPFFTVDLKDLQNLYRKGLSALVDPVKLLNCFYEICNKNNIDPRILIKVIFSKQKAKILKIGTKKFFSMINVEQSKDKTWQIKKGETFISTPKIYFKYKNMGQKMDLKDSQNFVLENIQKFDYLVYYSDKNYSVIEKEKLKIYQIQIIFANNDDEMKENLQMIKNM